MTKEEVNELARKAFADNDPVLLQQVEQAFAALSPKDRIRCWTLLTRGGFEELELVRYLNRPLGRHVLAVFQVPCGEAGPWVVPKYPWKELGLTPEEWMETE